MVLMVVMAASGNIGTPPAGAGQYISSRLVFCGLTHAALLHMGVRDVAR